MKNLDPNVSYFPVRDFDAIRVRCNHADCQFVFELPAQKIEEAMKKTNGCCPLCGKPFISPDVEGGANVLVNLAKAIIALDKLHKHVGVFFPVEQKTT